MNHSPLTKRTGIFALLLIGLVATIGCETPLSMLRAILLLQPPNASTIKTSDAADQDEKPSASEADLPKAEDLVADWEKPVFALFITGRQHGYIEPCGCTGLENQKGGLMRRHSCQKVLKKTRGWDLISLDVGNQVRRFGQQPIVKLSKTYESLCRIFKYDVVGLGPDDLKIPSIDLAQTMLSAPTGQAPFTCANVEVVDASLSHRFMIIQKNGKRIGVTMILGGDAVKELANSEDLTVIPPAQGLAQVVPKLAQCDFKVLLAHAPLEECRALAKKFPVFDLLVTAGGAGDPTLNPELIPIDKRTGRSTSMIQVGVKGMYVGLIGYYEKDGHSEIKYQRIPLDARFEDSPEMKEIFISYQNVLKQLWTTGQLADIKPRPHPSGHQFVGHDACADCHDEEFDIWENGVDGDGGPHEKTMRDLTHPGQRTWVQRHFDPECVSCHVTGWNPQHHYPYVSGYLDFERDVKLHPNGCENCHGPGSAHVDAERNHKNNDALLKKLRGEMRVTLQEARESACAQCHDLDNSPDFVKEGGFDKYWPKIEH